jgi:membrane protein
MPLTRIGRILQRTFQAFVEDNITRLGAALAFYTTIAVAPLMILALALAGVFFEESVAREAVVSEIRDVIGAPAAEAVASLESPQRKPEGMLATVVGGVSMVFGAFGVFGHLQDALNSIWRVTPPQLGFWAMLWHRIFSFAIVLATGFLLLVSLILSAGLVWLTSWGAQRAGLPSLYLELANSAVSFAIITLLFALLFKLLPAAKVPWRHVWLGAVVTAALFTLGKLALGYYLAHARVASAYGAAGSLVALLLWCYYAGQIVFLGAEFTRVTTLSNGGRDFSPLDRPTERIRVASQRPGQLKHGSSTPRTRRRSRAAN